METDRLRNNKIVILDSNALFIPFKFGVDLEKELSRLLGSCRIVVPSSVIKELKNLADHDAKAPLALAQRYETIQNEGNGDDAILKMAKKMNGIVVTNDKDLKKRLRGEKLPVIYLRGKNRLEMVGL